MNLVAGRQVVPELVQGAVTPAALSAAVAPLLDPGSAETVAQRTGLGEVRRLLGGGGAAGRVAELAMGLLRR